MRARWLIPLILIIGVIGEVWVLVLAVNQFGILITVGLLVGMAALGAYLWRRQGTKAINSLFDAPDKTDQVQKRVTDAALVVIAGGLLVLPGFISDILALFCLLPGTRTVARSMVGGLASTVARPYRTQVDLIDLRLNPDSVVEGEMVTDEPPASPNPRPEDPTIIRGEIEE